ncbi:MAG TPA: O-antigen ligase family protein, partial [Gemmataceae bacterium]|nr:O-antigen ligase family protein [Gemmataceae bacterium]
MSTDLETPVSRWLRWAIEAITLSMVVGSAWAFGCADPPFEFFLHVGVGTIGVLWAIRMVVQGKLQWQFSPVSLSMLAIFAIGLYQLVPLPRAVLRAISPANVSLIDRLLPDEAEVLPFGLETDPNLPKPNQTLSVYPAATRYALFRLLAVLVLCESVRNVCASRAAFLRFSICAFLNAVALSFVAILQFISSPPNIIYWYFHSPSSIFGTFLCRNHFPFYVNMGLGLGLGMFFAVMDQRDYRGRSGERRSRRSRRMGPTIADVNLDPFPKNLILRFADWIQTLLSNPTALWICAGVALIVCADFLSLSRGGVLALAAAALACSIYKSVTLSSRSLSAGVIVVFALAFGLVNWLGWNIVEARLGTLLSKDGLSNRTPIWSDSLKGFWEAPILGSGYGTFQYVEAMHRTLIGDIIVIFDHAHNDYLEAAIEGGVCRLIAALCAIVFVYVAGFRSLRRLAGERDADFVLGALVAFTTVVIHSFGEFGLFTPAVTVLGAVLVGQICGSEVWTLERRLPKFASDAPKVSLYAL